MNFPKGSRFIKFNLNETKEAQILDLLLDGNDPTPININEVAIPANTLEVTQLTFNTNLAFAVVSPRNVKIEPKEDTVVNNIKLTNDLIEETENADD